MDKRKLFISYKTGADDNLTARANLLKEALLKDNYPVWIDTADLTAGLEWNKQIFEQIPQSEILLLLIANRTVESPWVQREVAIAKATKVTVLPVLIEGVQDVGETLDKFDLPRTQVIDYKTAATIEYTKLKASIDKLVGTTVSSQREWIAALVPEIPQKPKPQQFDPTNQDYALFELGVASHPDVRIHLAAGDMMQMKNIDVFVNSENDYLQMARIFDNKTISAQLRYYGSLSNEADRTVQDSLQDELNAQISAQNVIRPCGVGTVILTSAGHPQSRLCSYNRVRYIFHAATVSVRGYGIFKRLEAMEPEGISACVVNILKKVWEVNDAIGIISPKDTIQRQIQEDAAKKTYKQVNSILLPLIGTGHGGRSLDEVMRPMLNGVKEFFVSWSGEKPTTIKHVYICAYSQEDVTSLEKALNEKFRRIEE